jgi:hypothetical protein
MVCSFRKGVTEGSEKREFGTAAVKENSSIETCPQTPLSLLNSKVTVCLMVLKRS